jgi:LmbE family N-acetylglucosaminyl deacetylase
MLSRVWRLFPVFAALAVAAPFGAGAQLPIPQYRIQPLSDLNGAPALSLALRRLKTVGTLMQTTAHPDDENNAMLALYARHLGMRVALVTATRGDGGQNEIGSELFDALGILRTEELLAAHRIDGAEQYFTRAVDFGYSFSTQETLDKWGRDEILGDYVRHIRAIRPEVMVSMSSEGPGGGQHHQTSGILTTEAYRAAADPARFPEQIKEGLRPWQVQKLYRPVGGFGGRGGRGGPGAGQRGGGRGAGAPAPAAADGTIATLDTNVYEPLLGCTIGEAGSVASGMHMCQGRVPMVAPPGASGARYRLVESILPKASAERSLFDGIDASIPGLARYAGARPPDALVGGLAAIASRVDAASRALESRGPLATVGDLVAALAAVRDLSGRLGSMGLSDAAKYEIEPRLNLKESQLEDALALAHALRIDATASDGLIVHGQTVGVSVAVANRGDGPVAVRSVTLTGFDGPAGCPAGVAALDGPFACSVETRTPAAARLTDVYWRRPEDAGRATFEPDAPFGLPFRPTPFRARIELEVAGARITRDLPIQYRYEGAALAGEKRMELNVVPAFAVAVSPGIAVFPAREAAARAPAARTSTQREIRVTVVNGTRGPATATVRLQAPDGWRVAPPAASLSFSREDEAVTTRFAVGPPASVRNGDVELTAVVTSEAAGSSEVGYQVIEYPHIQRRHKLIPATTRVKVIDVAVAPALSVGYIMGVGDQVPSALQQLGARVALIDADELAWGDLSKYHTIVTGVRAYERRADLRANNHRLLKYVENGGTVIVQYNRMEFNQAQYGPYKALVGSERITDENAPVKVLTPDHPAFTYPNRIADRDWQGWVQERGTYFLAERDAKYVDLVEMEDPFEYNPGPKRGALVEARYGKGRWVYCGLVLWRQLPSGTDGAYRLFANLISLGKPRGRED